MTRLLQLAVRKWCVRCLQHLLHAAVTTCQLVNVAAAVAAWMSQACGLTFAHAMSKMVLLWANHFARGGLTVSV
jgi:hypothetical protein